MFLTFSSRFNKMMGGGMSERKEEEGLKNGISV